MAYWRGLSEEPNGGPIGGAFWTAFLQYLLEGLFGGLFLFGQGLMVLFRIELMPVLRWVLERVVKVEG